MLDQQLQAILDHATAAHAPDLSDLPPPAAREYYRHLATVLDVKPAPEIKISTQTINGPGGPLNLRIYEPPTASTPDNPRSRGLVVYLHGGGFVVGSADCYDGVCTELCRQSECVFLQVDYRLAPEHPFPAAVDDCYAALTWAATHAKALGCDPERIAVAGDSAGGNLAAVMAILARDENGPKLRQQVLIYPVTAPVPEMFPSYAQFGTGTVLTTRATRSFNAFYFPDSGRAPDFRGAPLLEKKLEGLPPALVIVGGHDVLRDEGIAYTSALQAAGNHTILVEYAGLSHGFISMSAALDAAKLAVSQVALALKNALR